MQTSIIIPTYNHLSDCLQPCCDSIIKNTNLDDVEVIVVANGCTDGTKEYLENLGKPFKLLEFKDALGYTVAVNEGMKASKGDYIALLNNDVVLLDTNWLPMLMSPFLLNSDTGITGPLKFTWPCGSTTRTAIAFWCCMFKRSIINEIGFLDPIYNPGMGEDGAYCIEIESIGYKIVQVPVDTSKPFGEGINEQTFPIWHKGNGTFADDENKKNEIINRNTKILEQKYDNRLETSYQYCLNNHSDTNELFPYFRRYANRCDHITEFGVRDVYSTFAFIAAKPKKMLSYDLYTSINIGGPTEIATEAGIDYKFIEKNVLEADIEETDLLFIDTLHTYGQLSQELKIHANKARKYLMFHDTFTWGEVDEVETTTEKKGLNLAIKEFLIEYSEEWILDFHTDECNGLTVLKRIPKFSIIIPASNSNTIDSCVDRILSFTNLKGVEIIVVANGLNSKALDKLYSMIRQVTIINLVDKAGQIDPVNIGVKASSGDYVILIDDDCYLLPQEKDTWIKMLYEPFEKNVNVGQTGNFRSDYPDIGQALHSGCTMIKKCIWDEVGGADPIYGFGYFWDADLSFKIKEKYDVVVVGEENGQLIFPIYHPESPIDVDKKKRDLGLLEKNRDILYSRFCKKVKNMGGMVSIVIPTYQHCSDLLKPCIDSIIKHTDFNNIEIIVSANGCTDETKSYVEGLGEPFKLIWNEERLGYTKATNIGIQAAQGEFVLLLNNDVILLDQNKNDWINILKQPFLDDPKVGITGPLELFDNYSGHKAIIFFCTMIRKEIFDKTGLLDLSYSPGGGEDVAFSVEIERAGYKSFIVGRNTDSKSPNVGSFPIWHKEEGTFTNQEFPEYSQRIIKENGMKNMLRYHPSLKDGLLKLNFGSGGVEIPGYISVDKYDQRASIKMDVFKFDLLLDNTIDEILSSHMLEHINPYKVSDLLRKWFGLLKPGGKLILEMPDIVETCKAMVTAKDKWERYGLINTIFGSVNTTNNDDPSSITAPHLFGWYNEILYDHLAEIGFVDIQFMPEQFPHPGHNFRTECRKP